MRIYLDTNVLVAAFATRGLCTDVLHAVLAEHQLIVGEAGLAEVQRVLRRKLRLPPEALAEVDALLRQQGEVGEALDLLPISVRDGDDRIILSEAVAGGAEVLVTGDRDLLDIADQAPLPIVTPRGLWELLRTSPRKK